MFALRASFYLDLSMARGLARRIEVKPARFLKASVGRRFLLLRVNNSYRSMRRESLIRIPRIIGYVRETYAVKVFPSGAFGRGVTQASELRMTFRALSERNKKVKTHEPLKF